MKLLLMSGAIDLHNALSGHLVLIELTGGTIASRYPYKSGGLAALTVWILFIFWGHLFEIIVHFLRGLPGNRSFPNLDRHKND